MRDRSGSIRVRCFRRRCAGLVGVQEAASGRHAIIRPAALSGRRHQKGSHGFPIKKPAQWRAVDVIAGTAGEAWYYWRMDYTDYLLIKAGVLIVLAFAYGIYRGFNGQ